MRMGMYPRVAARARAALLAALPVAFLAACGSSTATQGPGQHTEIPPLTKDPGATRDERPLQPAPPIRPEGGPHSHVEPGPAPAPAAPRAPAERGGRDGASGSPCLSGGDCQSGVCEGQGCTDDRPGTCAPRVRPCTKDLHAYCGCDGATFRASGTCPGRRFASREACSR